MGGARFNMANGSWKTISVESTLAGLIIASAAILNAVRSIHLGRASGDIGYDDVSYLLSAFSRSQTLLNTGLNGFVAEFFNKPPHSFLLDLAGSITFSFFGPSSSAFYSVYAAAVAIAIFWSTFGFLPKPNPLRSAVLSAALLLSPLGFFMSSQLRPDPIYAVVLAGILARATLWNSSPQTQTHTHTRVRTLGIAIAILLYLKPSFFPITAIVTAYLVSLELFQHPTSSWRHRARKAGALLGWVGAYGSVFIVFGLPQALNYIFLNMLGEQADLWVEGDWLFAYVTSIKQSWSFTVPTLVLGLIGIAAAMIGRRFSTHQLVEASRLLLPYLGGLLLINLGVYSIRSVSAFFGLTALLPLTMLVFVAGTNLLFDGFVRTGFNRDAHNELRVKLIAQKALLVVGVSLLIFGNPLPRNYTYVETLPPIRTNQVAAEVILDSCAADSKCLASFIQKGQFPPTLIAQSSELEVGSLSWFAITNGWDHSRVTSPPLGAQEQSIVDLTSDSYFCVLADSGASYVGPFPINKQQDLWYQELMQSGEWEEIAPTLLDGRYHIFKRNF